MCLARGHRHEGFRTRADVFGDRLTPLAQVGDDALNLFTEVAHRRLAARAPDRRAPAEERGTGGFIALCVGFDDDSIQVRRHRARRGGKVLEFIPIRLQMPTEPGESGITVQVS
jgi:hypothetical protein